MTARSPQLGILSPAALRPSHATRDPGVVFGRLDQDMDILQLEQAIEAHFEAGAAAHSDPAAMTAFLELREALETGQVRSASPDPDSLTGWRVNAWVKKGI